MWIITWFAHEGKDHYENTPIQIYRKNSPPKTENFQIKKTPDIFHISAQNIGTR